MPKSLFIDPNEVLRPKEHEIKFPEIPVMTYDKTVKEELEEGHFTKQDLLNIYRDMFTIREFETMLNLVKTTGGYNGVDFKNCDYHIIKRFVGSCVSNAISVGGNGGFPTGI